jgi:predicted type IV restriction endonuclease
MIKKPEITRGRQILKRALEQDQNEADTRRGIERVLEGVCGLDPLENLSRESAVRGAGETEYVDFVLLIKGEIKMMIEVKRIGLSLAPKHLNQLSKYTFDKGCQWALLTNGKQWRLLGASYGQPPKLTEILRWDFLEDKPDRIAECMQYLTLRSIKKNELEALWERRIATLPENVLSALMGNKVLNEVRREIFKNTNSKVQVEDVADGIRHLLNDKNLSRLDELGLPKPPLRRAKAKPKAKVKVVPKKRLLNKLRSKK